MAIGYLLINIFSCSLAFAQEITILYTGETHAMLYPCNCPVELDGGIARRATLLKQLKNNIPGVLVLDTGGFFAGGLMDAYTQNVELDMQRSLINLAAMGLMNYDACAIGDDEFNFGKEFLLKNIAQSKIAFLSCNMSGIPAPSNPVKPYLIKEVSGVKVGLIGLTTPQTTEKAGGYEFSDPAAAVRQTIEELKQNKVDIVILLSHLGEISDLNLIKEVQGIDVLFSGHTRNKDEIYTKTDSTLLVRPSWQGRRLGKLSLEIKDKKIVNFKAEELRLSDLIIDDPEILSILPACFSDLNCSKAGLSGRCDLPGQKDAQCIMERVNKINLTIILPKNCITCKTEKALELLKTFLPGIEASYLYYPDRQAKKLINELAIKTLPAYLLDKKIDKEKAFTELEQKVQEAGRYYALKPEFSGISYFLTREKSQGQLDLFISLFDRNIHELLGSVRDLKPVIHFLAVDLGEPGFNAAYGRAEVEEYLRSVCVNKYYPEHFWDYISCRAKNINSSWWQDCLFDKIMMQKVEDCARSQEGRSLLTDNIALNKEIQVMHGPTYLLNNQEIFTSTAEVKQDELKLMINKQ